MRGYVWLYTCPRTSFSFCAEREIVLCSEMTEREVGILRSGGGMLEVKGTVSVSTAVLLGFR